MQIETKLNKKHLWQKYGREIDVKNDVYMFRMKIQVLAFIIFNKCIFCNEYPKHDAITFDHINRMLL